MADITMCKDMKCPVKFRCYRHTAPENQFRQAVFSESPREGINVKVIGITKDAPWTQSLESMKTIMINHDTYRRL